MNMQHCSRSLLVGLLAGGLWLTATTAQGQGEPPSSFGMPPTPATLSPTIEVLPPMELMKAKTQELKRLFQTPVSPARTQQVKELANTLINYQELSQRSLGDKQWSTLQEAQRQEFVTVLRALIEKNYVEQTERNPQFEVTWKEQELGKQGDRARVVSLASSKGSELELEYRLQLKPSGWIVYDLLVDGVSMTKNYYKSFHRIIAKDGWDGLISRMKKKLAGGTDDELEREATRGIGAKKAGTTK